MQVKKLNEAQLAMGVTRKNQVDQRLRVLQVTVL